MCYNGIIVELSKYLDHQVLLLLEKLRLRNVLFFFRRKTMQKEPRRLKQIRFIVLIST